MARGASAKTVMWFRNDLRLADNAALRAACAEGSVLPLFVFDPELGGSWALGGASRWWLHGSLLSLAAALKRAGAELVLRRGRAADIVPAMAREIGAVAVHCGRAHEPGIRAADEAVAAALPEGCRFEQHRVATLFDYDAVRTKTGGVFGVYTPFARACRAQGAPDEPVAAPKTIAGVEGVRGERLEAWGLLPTKPDWAAGLRETWTPGEKDGEARLKRFLAAHLDEYGTERDRPGNENGTSMLSPHLHWGEISPNQVWHAAGKADGRGREKFENEILWHDFAAYQLWHHPTIPDEPMHAAFAGLPWRRDERALAAWQQGRTGVPIVDAGMRQLWRIGWMHNRVRMITASFLVKHLLIAWQEGEAWFWDTLVDADLATNGVSWQWIAGSGTDNSPFFRVFNPVTQATKFDPKGAYVRRWVPELARLPDRYVHAPWEAPAHVLEEAGVALGRDYPEPIVGLDEGRDRALAVFRTHVRGKRVGAEAA